MDNRELQNLKNKYDIIGNDPALNDALEIAVAVARTELPVLITGESGVGKDVIPKIIHQHSLRKNANYFAVNCGAIPEGTVDSELFGHVKGSFTGAVGDRKGYFEVADQGTLFLDEIGELPKSSQAKLLRVLQSGEYIRVGDSVVRKTNVRVIAATNIDLLHAVKTGRFREDLYYRLEAIRISLPALRERPGDIPLLFRKFASDFSAKYIRSKVVLSPSAETLLRSFRWPGNIRQLKNIADRVCIFEGLDLMASERCVVDDVTLAKYLPKDSSTDVVLFDSGQQHDVSSTEIKMMQAAILKLTSDVEEIKKHLPSMVSSAPGVPKSLPASPARGIVAVDPPYIHEEPDEQGLGDLRVEESVEEPSTHIQDAKIPKKTLVEMERDRIEEALTDHSGNRKKAAEELGISERNLYRKIKDYNLGK